MVVKNQAEGSNEETPHSACASSPTGSICWRFGAVRLARVHDESTLLRRSLVAEASTPASFNIQTLDAMSQAVLLASPEILSGQPRRTNN